MHLKARLDASCRPLSASRLRGAARTDASLPETSAETLDDPWPLTEVRRPRPRAADSLRRSEEHQGHADARPRYAPRGTVATRRPGAAPRGVPHRATLGAEHIPRGTHHQTLRPRDDPKTAPAPRASRPSEDRRVDSRACAEPQDLNAATSYKLLRPEGRKREGGKCFETLRTDPRLETITWRPRRNTTRDLARFSALGAHQHRPPSTRHRSEE